MRTNGFLIVLFFTLFFICTAGCAYPIRYDGPYQGRVIDAETKQPIEGVVVLGVWYKEEPNVAGSTSTFYDAKETVTDKNGDFKIPGMGLKILSNVGTMNVLIFKAGYEYMRFVDHGRRLKKMTLLKKTSNGKGEKRLFR